MNYLMGFFVYILYLLLLFVLMLNFLTQNLNVFGVL
jgi:hypothetical protein